MERVAGAGVKPYFEEDGVTIYHGDCREVLPDLEAKADLVLSDPPYNFESKGGGKPNQSPEQ
jgi:site-specific DNA-methyltransferase (adenine-specific)